MHPRYRLRVELADQPGALSRITGILAACGADVVSVDIHDLDEGRAIDEIVVRVPDGWTPDVLTAELVAAHAGVLLDCSTAGPRVDSVARTLRWIHFAIETGVQHSDLELGRMMAELCPGAVAWICEPDEARTVEVGAAALERGGPVARYTDSLPDQLTAANRDNNSNGWRSGWLLAVPDDPERPHAVALVARPGDLRFTATEIQRVEALLQLACELSARLR
jgi:ACT domain